MPDVCDVYCVCTDVRMCDVALSFAVRRLHLRSYTYIANDKRMHMHAYAYTETRSYKAYHTKSVVRATSALDSAAAQRQSVSVSRSNVRRVQSHRVTLVFRFDLTDKFATAASRWTFHCDCAAHNRSAQ